MLLPVLVLLISVLLTVGWMTPAHGEATTPDQNSNGRIKVIYDKNTDVHTVEGKNIILFCMNNQMHWPQSTPGTPNVPMYEEGYLTKDNFQEKTGRTDYDKFIRELSVLLYAGYPYNGLGFLPDEGNGSVKTISEDGFRELLIPTAQLRSVFSDQLGTTKEGQPVEDLEALKEFLNAVPVYAQNPNGADSDMNYQDIIDSAFYRAAFCAVYCNDLNDGRVMYEKTYLNESPYVSTSNAIWRLMKDYGISNNNEMSLSDKSRELLEAAKTRSVSIPLTKPTSEDVQIVGDTAFKQSKEDGKWYTGELRVMEPADFHGAYTIKLPEGTSLSKGSTSVKAGEPFRLVSEKKPEGEKTVTVSAKIPWLSVKMYSPVKNAAGQEVTASDGKSFQHMVGAEIETAAVGASADLKVSTETPNPSNPPSTTDPSNPGNPSNPSTPTDPSTPVTPPNPVNPNGPVIPPNQENTSASEEPASPEHTVSRETPAANQPAASKKPTAVKKSDGNGKQKVSASVLPKTGDSSHVMLWGLGLIGCGAAALGLLMLRIRNRKEE